jgi:hypothetical protein
MLSGNGSINEIINVVKDVFLTVFLNNPPSIFIFPICVILFLLIYFSDRRSESYVRGLIDNCKWDEGRSKIPVGMFKVFVTKLDADAPFITKLFTVLFKMSFAYLIVFTVVFTVFWLSGLFHSMSV